MTMKIATNQISSQGVTLTYRKTADEFSVLKEMVKKGEVRSFSPLEIEVFLAAREGYYEMSGWLATRVGLACSRCLAPFYYELQQRFTLRFSQEITRDLDPDEEEDIELMADQIGLTFFQGEALDIQAAVQEQVVLALPFKPLCSLDCKGLCPKCGTDLNQTACRCGSDGGGGPFDVLKTLKLG